MEPSVSTETRFAALVEEYGHFLRRTIIRLCPKDLGLLYDEIEQPAAVQYAGRAPGFVGLNQINVHLPAGIAPGAHTVTVSRGGVASNSITVELK
jgi:hypothetical protein